MARHRVRLVLPGFDEARLGTGEFLLGLVLVIGACVVLGVRPEWRDRRREECRIWG